MSRAPSIEVADPLQHVAIPQPQGQAPPRGGVARQTPFAAPPQPLHSIPSQVYTFSLLTFPYFPTFGVFYFPTLDVLLSMLCVSNQAFCTLWVSWVLPVIQSSV